MNHAESDSSIPLRAATLEPIDFDSSRSQFVSDLFGLSPQTACHQRKTCLRLKKKRESKEKKRLQLARRARRDSYSHAASVVVVNLILYLLYPFLARKKVTADGKLAARLTLQP